MKSITAPSRRSRKPTNLTEVWRRHVVVHRVEIAVIRHVKRIEAQPDVVLFAALRSQERNGEDSIDFHV